MSIKKNDGQHTHFIDFNPWLIILFQRESIDGVIYIVNSDSKSGRCQSVRRPLIIAIVATCDSMMIYPFKINCSTFSWKIENIFVPILFVNLKCLQNGYCPIDSCLL